MTLTPFQFTYNGLTWGPGTDVQLVGSKGLREAPAVRQGDVSIPRINGAYPGIDVFEERIFTVDLLVSVTKTLPFDTVIANVANALQLVTDPSKQTAMQFMQPGWATARQITCRPTRAGFPMDLNYSFHNAAIATEFTASDPLIYDTVLQSVSAGLPSPTAGLMFPVTFPVTFGASTGGSMQVTNGGNFITAPVFTITGPCTNPSVSLVSTGQFMKLNLSLGATDVLVVDMGQRLVTLNGTAARFNAVATGSSWFGFPPGTSSVGVASSDSAQVAAVFTAAFRSAWGWA